MAILISSYGNAALVQLREQWLLCTKYKLRSLAVVESLLFLLVWLAAVLKQNTYCANCASHVIHTTAMIHMPYAQ